MSNPLMVAAATAKRINSEYYVEGYATTFDDPYKLYEYDGVEIYEKVDRRALDGVDLSDVIFQYDHTGRVYARTSNKTLVLEADERGLCIAADLSKSNGARDIYEDIKSGLITKMSWGFIVQEDRWETEGNKRIRTILKIKKIYDVSAVSIPANDCTSISARNVTQGRLDAERRESLEKRVRILKLKINLEEKNDENFAGN